MYTVQIVSDYTSQIISLNTKWNVQIYNHNFLMQKLLVLYTNKWQHQEANYRLLNVEKSKPRTYNTRRMLVMNHSFMPYIYIVCR